MILGYLNVGNVSCHIASNTSLFMSKICIPVAISPPSMGIMARAHK